MPKKSTPVPDPTQRTTEQVERFDWAERDYVDGQIGMLKEHLRGIDKATELLNETVNRVPTDMQQAVQNLRELTEEKFDSVAIQFKERDTRSEREGRDNIVKVDAAFAAQKEAAVEQNKSNTLAIGKSEDATKEAINKLEQYFQTTASAISDKIDDLKDRVGDVEGQRRGARDVARTVDDRSARFIAAVVGLSTVILAIAGIVTAIIIHG